jgi:hypothetical protein
MAVVHSQRREPRTTYPSDNLSDNFYLQVQEEIAYDIRGASL